MFAIRLLCVALNYAILCQQSCGRVMFSRVCLFTGGWICLQWWPLGVTSRDGYAQRGCGLCQGGEYVKRVGVAPSGSTKTRTVGWRAGRILLKCFLVTNCDQVINYMKAGNNLPTHLSPSMWASRAMNHTKITPKKWMIPIPNQVTLCGKSVE